MSEWKQGAAARRDFRATKDGPEEMPRARRKKPKKWCRGHVGREHVLGLIPGSHPCSIERKWWPCTHKVSCLVCGKTVRWNAASKYTCPGSGEVRLLGSEQ